MFCEECGQTINSNARTLITTRDHKQIYSIPIEDVRFFKAKDKYVTVYYGEGKVLMQYRTTIRDLKKEFDGFVQVHRNALINPKFFKSMVVTDRPSYTSIKYSALVDGHLVAISRSFNKVVKDLCAGVEPTV